MKHTVKFAGTEEELQAILKLRYLILRAPWQQAADTATDHLEAQSYNAYIANENNEVLACGRLQVNEGGVAQVRFMAVLTNMQGKGLGKLILQALEKKALELNLNSVELQARENAVPFYKSCGYNVVEETFKLWGIIQHYLMRKALK